jgi:hypothetical protein
MQPGGPVQQPYARVDNILQSGTKNLASELYITPFFPTQSSRTLVITSTGQITLSSVPFCPYAGDIFAKKDTHQRDYILYKVTFSLSEKDVTEVISIHRHTAEFLVILFQERMTICKYLFILLLQFLSLTLSHPSGSSESTVALFKSSFNAMPNWNNMFCT